MYTTYEKPEILFVIAGNEDIISTSNNGIDLPDVPLGNSEESEMM